MDKLIKVWEICDNKGLECAAFLKKEDAKKTNIFPNGHGKPRHITVSVSAGDIALLRAGLPIFNPV